MNNRINIFVEYFNNNKEKLKNEKEEQNNFLEIEKFKKEFPLDKIKNLTLDQYMFKRGTKNTFCSKLMNEYKCGPNIVTGSIQSKFGIYYINGIYLDYKNNIIDNPQEYYNKLNSQLVKVLTKISSGEQDIDYSKYNYLYGMWHSILKMSYFIKPENNITFGSKKILKAICFYFGIKVGKNDNSLNLSYRLSDKLKKCIDNNMDDINSISTYHLSIILWNFYKDIIEKNKISYVVSVEELREEEEQHLKINSGCVKSYSRKELEQLEIAEENYHYKSKTKVNNKEVRKTDVILKATRIKMANHKCEINKNHKSFTDKTGKHQYLECHHIIPISAQKDFPNIKLDSMFNIIALCPNCHKKVHYALKEERKDIFMEMYEIRRKEMLKRGFDSKKIIQIFNDYY